jgi:hypothetical protein
MNLYIATFKIEIFDGNKSKVSPKEHIRIIWAQDEGSAIDKLEISVLENNISAGSVTEQITDLEITQAII